MFAVPPNTIARATTADTVHPALIASQYATNRESWAHLLRYDPDERFTALVHRTMSDGSLRKLRSVEQEVWLMSWLPGQHTDLHDHGSATGAFTIVSGVLTEHARGTSRELVPGQSRVFGPGYAHQVRNEGPDPAVSLHVYRAARIMRAVTPLRQVS